MHLFELKTFRLARRKLIRRGKKVNLKRGGGGMIEKIFWKITKMWILVYKF